jgi:transposase
MKKIGIKGKTVRGAGVQTRNQYTTEFKSNALARCIREGVSVTARDLDLPESMLYAWRKKAELSASVSESERVQGAEIARLKRAVSALEEENSFLKKAAAYFAKVPK